jgi:hypothetical protein
VLQRCGDVGTRGGSTEMGAGSFSMILKWTEVL